MKKPIIGLVLFLMSGLALADCPDIGGKWGVQLSESLDGEQVAGVGRGTFRDNGTWVLKFYVSFEADQDLVFIRGDYAVDSKCIVEASYTVDDSDDGKGSEITGEMASIIIDEDNMFMVLVDEELLFNANVIAERLSEAEPQPPQPVF
jgi:hypothetical protein